MYTKVLKVKKRRDKRVTKKSRNENRQQQLTNKPNATDLLQTGKNGASAAQVATTRYCTATRRAAVSAKARHPGVTQTHRRRACVPQRPAGQNKQHLHHRQEHEVHEDEVEQQLEAHVDGEIANRVNGHLGIIYGTRAKPGGGGV